MKNFQSAKDVLSDYFGITLPDELLTEIIENDQDLLHEVETGGISDTMCRDDLIEAVLVKLNMPHWPTYGDTAKDPLIFEKFINKLEEHLWAVDGKLR